MIINLLKTKCFFHLKLVPESFYWFKSIKSNFILSNWALTRHKKNWVFKFGNMRVYSFPDSPPPLYGLCHRILKGNGDQLEAMSWVILTLWFRSMNPSHPLRLRISLCIVSEMTKGVHWQTWLIEVWVLAFYSSTFKAIKEPLFCLGKNAKCRLWECMFLVLFG